MDSRQGLGDLVRALAADPSRLAETLAVVEQVEDELVASRRTAEQAKTFVALIENSTDMIAMAALDGRVLFVNRAGRALVGMDPTRDARELMLADFHTEAGLQRATILHEHGSWQGEGVLRHQQTGELIPTQVSSFVARDADGAPLCFATIQRDLRTTKRLETELRQAQKMEALGRLAGGIAHDFNNLLTVILSYSAMLMRELPTASAARDDVDQISRAGQRAAELTRQLLAFSRQQVLEPKPLDLNQTLRAMDGMIRRLIDEDIELRIVTGAEVGAVMADAGQVEQVVMNLVVNARDAMSTGGVLTLATERIELDTVAAATLELAPGVYNTLAVSDTGAGIDEQTQANLFEPFFTTKASGKGTGLGLSTVMGIVKQSGGHVAVTSRIGHGSTFRVYLPSTTRVPSADPSLGAAPLASVVGGRAQILVVEDEREVRELISEVLRQAGYRVIAASDGEEALQMFEAVTDLDLLLTDVIMPRMSGPQLAARVRELCPAIRVLYMSGYTDDKLGHHGILDPGVELVGKPLTPDLLLDRVRRILA